MQFDEMGKELNPNFPREDVEACMKEKLDSSLYVNRQPCPGCGKKSEELNWIRFTSPRRTWEMLCGRSGPLSVCPECHIQVEFILVAMN